MTLSVLQGCSSDEDDDGTTSSPGTTSSSATSSGVGASGGSDPSGTGGNVSSSSTTGQGGSAGEPGVGGGGSSACPSTHTCAEEAPVNWSGPIALSLGDMQPACVGSYPTNAGAYFGDLDPGAASCNCGCDPATGIQCNNGADLCYTSLANCAILACFSPSATVPPNSCTDIPSTAASKVQVSAKSPTNVGSCAATSNHVIPTPTWGTQAKACGGAATIPEACEAGEVCTPNTVAPFDKLCIQRTGEVACPNQFYSEQHIVYESFTDSRSCSPACSCGTATSSCGGSVTFAYPAGSIECGFATNTVSSGSCGPMDPQTDNAVYSPAPSGTCPPSASALSGDVTANSPVTFCCHP